MTLYNSLLDLIGNTPLVEISKINTGFSKILAKVEYFNPTGSVKDRAAFAMIEDAEKRGEIKPNETVIIEPTSGNTGIGLAFVCLLKGYKLILTMPESMSQERRDILKAYGAQLVLTSKALGMQGAIDEANKLNSEIKNSFIPQQFNNPSNAKIHYNTTANEIWSDTKGKVDIVVAGVGSAGTICGISKRLKELNPDLKAVAVEPASSPMLSKNVAGPHKIQGIGANFVPQNYDNSLVDEIMTVSDDDAIEYARLLASREGLFCGISSGAAICAAIRLSERKENKDKTIVVILPDSGMRYLSSDVFK